MSIVLKFGGTSISKYGFDVIVNEILKNKDKKIIIVLSALTNTTNLILKFLNSYNLDFIDKIKQNHIKFLTELDVNINCIKKHFIDLNSLVNSIILKKDDYLQKNELLSFGEYLSTFIFNEYIKNYNFNYKLVDSKFYIKSVNNSDSIKKELYMKGRFYCSDIINEIINRHNLIICQGFVASTTDDYKCTLSRGGSDTSAALIAAKINAERLEIWTDVDGIYNANPSIINNANIVKYIDYELSQELSAMGAKVLHPYCIKPCQKNNIPIFIKNTYGNNINNTKIGNEYFNEYMLMIDRNNIVFQVTSLDMWNDYGFVSHIFECFKQDSIDVNIITTAQFSVMATTNETNLIKIENCKKKLEKYYDVIVHDKCSIISIVGKSILHFDKFNKIFENIKKYDNLLISHFSSNNMCVSFVLPNDDGIQLYNEFYYKFFYKKKDEYTDKWWYLNKDAILEKYSNYSDIYLYNLDVVKEKCIILNSMKSIDRKFYAIKANNNINVIREIYNNNFGFECVSVEEVKYIKNNFKDASVLFTPNYCNINEYVFIYDNNPSNTFVTVDNYEVLKNNSNIFSGKDIILRLDMNLGDGHNNKVITEGSDSKFGLDINILDAVMNYCIENNINVIGFHSHRGSNINNISNWINAFNKIKSYAIQYNIKIINIGGGYGIKLNLGDYENLDMALEKVKDNFEIWIEPGRYIVADAGILLSKVNLVRKKGSNNFIGINTGMNSLMRPSLYDAYHPIYNLNKIDNENLIDYTIVGPICESGDILGKNRQIPQTNINDFILIDEAGAYGHTMSNNYNMRNPAKELIYNILDVNSENKINFISQDCI
jgi:bifunctional diaminopimelate decarboxylase / aspartate kinase